MSYKLFFFACVLNLFYYVPNLLSSPIIGGHPDTPNTYKYHVSIQYDRDYKNLNSGKLLCGGAIIHDRYVLTAAHCFMIKRDGRIEKTHQPRTLGIVVVAGTSETHGSGFITDIHTVFIPHAYNLGQEIYGDIAIVKLAVDLKRAVERGRVQILRLDPGHPLNFYENKNALVPGNGCDELYRGDDGVLRPQLNQFARIRQVLEVHIPERSHCPLYFDHSICALNLDKSEIRACAKGDSGSPLVYENTIIGVLSGSPKILQENDKNIMIFTRVSTFNDFITNAMNEHGNHSQMYILND